LQDPQEQIINLNTILTEYLFKGSNFSRTRFSNTPFSLLFVTQHLLLPTL